MIPNMIGTHFSPGLQSDVILQGLAGSRGVTQFPSLQNCPGGQWASILHGFGAGPSFGFGFGTHFPGKNGWGFLQKYPGGQSASVLQGFGFGPGFGFGFGTHLLKGQQGAGCSQTSPSGQSASVLQSKHIL